MVWIGALSQRDSGESAASWGWNCDAQTAFARCCSSMVRKSIGANQEATARTALDSPAWPSAGSSKRVVDAVLRRVRAEEAHGRLDVLHGGREPRLAGEPVVQGRRREPRVDERGDL